MKFFEAVKSAFRNWKDFSGRASRSEYWWFYLFSILVNILAVPLEYFTFSVNSTSFVDYYLNGGSGPFQLITQLILLVPGISVAARRLHDIGKSGWWQLIIFTIVGILVLMYWALQKGDVGDNLYGEDPLAPHAT